MKTNYNRLPDTEKKFLLEIEQQLGRELIQASEGDGPLDYELGITQFEGINIQNLTIYDEPKLKFIPDSIGDLSRLFELHIQKTNIDYLPKTLIILSDLIILKMQENNFREMPIWLSKCKNLHTLNFAENKISHIPNDLFKMQQLLYLNLSNNYLTHVPIEICKLNNLEKLVLTGNTIDNLDELKQKAPPKLNIIF